MRLRRNGLPCDVVERTRERAERQRKKRRLELTVLFSPPKNKERIRARGKQKTWKSETGKGRQPRCAAQIRATKLDKMQCAELDGRAKEEAGETTNKKSPDADSDEFLSPWSLAAAPGGRQRPEGQ